MIARYDKLDTYVYRTLPGSLERSRYADIQLKIWAHVNKLPVTDPLRKKFAVPKSLKKENLIDEISAALKILGDRLDAMGPEREGLEDVIVEHTRIGVRISIMPKELPAREALRALHKGVREKINRLKEALPKAAKLGSGVLSADPVTAMLGYVDEVKLIEDIKGRFINAWSEHFLEASWHEDEVKAVLPVLEKKFIELVQQARLAGAFDVDPDIKEINKLVADLKQYVVLLKEHGYYAQDEKDIDGAILDAQVEAWEVAGWVNGRHVALLKENPKVVLEDQVRPMIESTLKLVHGELLRQLGLVTEKNKDNSELGGIDLNGDRLNIKVKLDATGLPLPLEFQDPALMNIQGLTPIIREIIPNASSVIPLLSDVVK
jgi:hypothetical protein